ncbi:alpha/beta hydrolase [Kitasatospora sp. NPDC052868]|uniref:alpha/beta hydrolase n=1 Tax=Kitasatospora sp. NPDC052868 TaxID=3364060 RepID=UPI0037CAE18A
MLSRSLKALCGTVVLALTATLASVAQAQAAPPPPAPTWRECPPDPYGSPVDPRLRCTTLRVPLDYRAPSGPTIEIAVSRLATAKAGVRRGILLHNGGGPGGFSLNLPSAWVHNYPQDVLDRYDLVSFDPRGVGYSTPVTCGRTAASLPNERVLPYPAADGSIGANVTFARDLARDCLAHGGDVLRHITTANTARDMDRIRAALGERKLSYNAASYGSYLGAVYTELFPDRSDRIILDSNVDPKAVWHGQFALWDQATELRFGDFANWAVERESELHLGATPAEVRANFLALAARLDRTPVTHPQAGPVNGNLFRAVYHGYSYHTFYFPEIAAWWRFLDQGGPAPEWLSFPVVPGIPEDNGTASLFAVACGDARAPRDIGHYQREVTADRARYPLLAGMGTNILPCAFWPDPVEPPVRITDRGPRNVLLLQTARDPATPLAGALGQRGSFGKRAQLVTVNTGNHGAYDPFTPSCAVTAANRFLVTGVLPARDLTCEPDPVDARAAAPQTQTQTQPPAPGRGPVGPALLRPVPLP